MKRRGARRASALRGAIRPPSYSRIHIGEYESREKFDEADRLYAESGLSLLKSLERPLAVHAAAEQVQTVARELDQALDAAVEPAQRAKALDAAILSLTAERASVHVAADPLDPAERRLPGVLRTLDRFTPTRTSAPTFTELSGAEMVRALELRDQADKRISLDEAAASVAGYEPGDGVPSIRQPLLDGVQKGPGGELDDRIKAHVVEHGCGDYACGLAHVTGVGVGRPGEV